jgi:hypothetical protein
MTGGINEVLRNSGARKTLKPVLVGNRQDAKQEFQKWEESRKRNQKPNPAEDPF